MKTLIILSVVLTAWLTANFASAQTWTQTSAPSNYWNSVASSADGTKLVAVADNGGIHSSTNSGSTWAQTSAPSNDWTSVASSADGTILAATCVWDGVYVSTNSGAVWFHAVDLSAYWNSIAMSADGRKIVAVGETPNYTFVIYSSTNFGITWTSNSSPNNSQLFAIAASADGNKLVAAAANGGPIYTSTNSGAGWSLTAAPIRFWERVASSVDGTRLVAVAKADQSSNPKPDRIYASTNSGTTWTATSAPSNSWWSVASSADGTRLVATETGSGGGFSGRIYISFDSGVTWTQTSAPNRSWYAVASSADGRKMVAVNHGGGIWISQSTPVPWINLAPASGNLTLSWTVSSTNFVTQQSSDLGSWTDMTNQPVLNLTNLQNEVILSPTCSSAFYRLKTP